MVNIVPTLVSHKCNNIGYSQPLLMYLLYIIDIPEMPNNHFFVKKNISKILWGHIEMGEPADYIN